MYDHRCINLGLCACGGILEQAFGEMVRYRGFWTHKRVRGVGPAKNSTRGITTNKITSTAVRPKVAVNTRQKRLNS